MADVTVTPETFALVHFEAPRIADLVNAVAQKVGFADDTVVMVQVDEGNPLGRAKVTSLDPVTIEVQGGAFEDPKRPRLLSDASVQDVIGRLLFRAWDRLHGGFADAPADDKLDLAQHAAWDAFAVGRCQRVGLPVSKPRRLYHFRNRHGFTDVADAAFERLWSADALTWTDVLVLCAATAAARQPAA
jgi:hypothetical protein